jgi:hypothetical protein
MKAVIQSLLLGIFLSLAWSLLPCSPLLAADYRVFRTLDLGSGYHADILRDTAVDVADKDRGDDPLVLNMQNTKATYANAKFQVVGPGGNTVFSQVFERPLADFLTFTAKSLPQGGRLFWVMVDYSCGFGSYCGPAYLLGQFRDDKFQWAQAKTCNGKLIQVKVSSTMKTGWRVDPNGDILEVACRPYGGDKKPISDPVNFYVYHIRWHWDGAKWRFFETWGNGSWEDEDYGTGESKILGPETDFPKACKQGQEAEPFWSER